ncbi:hypothetical protein ADK41_11850 [Streptomyces caelestis]|uniref:Uncharacterized protein n=1 Tax=Streptomyces caelestis TaxID=36816 RepID=A0A0M9X9E7_9ACTN|nr:hypothetical protein ADK41_11850 [Streptomyces caelestis]KOV36406.1 hypothetical protein ADK58_01000 [Streptomyces sp. XY152]
MTDSSVVRPRPPAETSIRKSSAQAASRSRSTAHRSRTAPGPTRAHRGSEARLDRRVPASPSEAGAPVCSVREGVPED